MENIEKLLHQILDNQNHTRQDISNIKEDIVNIKQDISSINSRLDAVVEQTADLIEFKTQTNENFKEIRNTLDYLVDKEKKNEMDIFNLKKIHNMN